MEFVIANCSQLVICIVICLAKIIEISLQSIRVVFMVKGEKTIATILAFFECLLWGLVISAILTSLGDNLYWLVAYCLGFAFGIYFGTIIENKIALGTSSIQIIVNQKYTTLVESYLLESNKGYTLLNGHGSKEPMSLIIMVIPRKDVKLVLSKIRELCNNEVFVVASEVSKFVGGYGVRK